MAVADRGGGSPSSPGETPDVSPNAKNGVNSNKVSPEAYSRYSGRQSSGKGMSEMSMYMYPENPYAINPELRAKVNAMERVCGGLRALLDFNYVHRKTMEKSEVVLNTFAAVLFKCHKAEYANYVNLFKKMYTLTKSMKEPNKYTPSTGDPTPLLN